MTNPLAEGVASANGGGRGLRTISTCSYSRWHPSYGQPVRITLGRPRLPEPTGRRTWLYIAELSPRGAWFRAPADVFTRCYAAQLDRLAEDIQAKLAMLVNEFGPIVLCCYERRVSGPQDCHRRQTALWLEARLGITVPELDGR